MKLSTVAFRNIRRNKRRSILSGSAIAIAVMSMVMLFALEEGMMDDFMRNVKSFVTGSIRIRNARYSQNERLNPLHLRIKNYRQVMDICSQNENVAAISPKISFYTAIYRGGNNYRGIGIGVDFARAEKFQHFSKSLKEGRIPKEGSREILIAEGLAGEMKVGVGDKITLLSKSMYMGMTGMTFKVSGIVRFNVASFNKNFIFIPLTTVQRFLKMGDSVTEMQLLVKDEGKLDETVDELKTALKETPGLEVKSWKNIGTWYFLKRYADVAYQFIGLIFFILASTVIMNTTMMVVFERRREIGTIGAMGMTGSEIVLLFFLEAFFISLIASAAGALVGVALVLPFVKTGFDFSSMLQGISWEISEVIYPELKPGTVIMVFFYAVAVSSFASLIPSWRSSRVEPAEALRSV